MKEIQAIKVWTLAFEQIQTMVSDLETLLEFRELGEISDAELDSEHDKAEKALEELEFKKMLSAEDDQMSAILEINPGAGGTES